jgi:hypothetical protein
MRLVFFFVLVLCTYNLFAQSLITIKGQTKSGLSSLPYTNVSLKQALIGTCSNTEGYFEFNIPEVYINDTLQLSFIGYETLELPLNTLDANRLHAFDLKPSQVELGEVTVLASGLSAKEILLKAFRKKHKNYPGKYYVRGFYRLEGYVGTQVHRLIEADLGIRSGNMDFNPRKDHIYVYQLRKSNDLMNRHGWLRRTAEAKFYYFLNGEKYIKNELFVILDHKIPFSKNEVTNYHFTIKETLVDANKKYIVIKGTRFHDKVVNGMDLKQMAIENDSLGIFVEYYINADNYAIEKMKRYFLPGSKHPLPRKYYAYTEVSFKQIEDTYYPAVFIYEIYGGKEHDMFEDPDNQEKRQYQSYRFVVNEWTDKVVTHRREGKPYLSTPYDWLGDLTFPYHPEFWKSYNMLQRSEPDTLMFQELEKAMPLEQQFILNAE